MRPIKLWTIAVACIGVFGVLVGCGSDSSVDTGYVKEGLKTATLQRGLFDKVKGDWDKLSDADKAAFTKSANGDSVNAQASWLGMKSGPNAAQDYLRQQGRLH